jgi:CubicO group peptidase (beta-lactamase class C family)
MKKLVALFVLSTVISFAQNIEPRFKRIDSLLTYLQEKDKFMGGLTIREGENIVFSNTYGAIDTDLKLNANPNTKYKIGSITKTFTAIMIMQLMEEKKLRPETKLTKFFPKIPSAELISIEDLLHHRSGIKDYVNQDSITAKDLAKGDLKKNIIKKIENYELDFVPNSQALYSNSNYFLLGLIIEKLTNESYAENLQKRIVSKIGLKNTYLPVENANASKNESLSFHYNGTKWEAMEEWPIDIAFAAGGIISTTDDLTHLIQSLFEGKLINPSSLEEMKKIKDGYGKGLVQFPFGERKFYGHNGKIENFISMLGYYPKDKLSVSLIVNGNNYNSNDIMIGILSIYYKIPYPFPVFVTLDGASIKAFMGTYTTAEMPLKLTISQKDGNLFAQATGQSAFPLTPKNENTFVFPAAGIEIIFETNTLTLKQGGQKFKFTKE